MACPKPRIVYPDTATRLEQPLTAIINKIDPDFAKEHRFDVAYRFGRRVFKEDSLMHGAYVTITLMTEAGQEIFQLGIDDPSILQVLTQGRQDGVAFIEAENGFIFRTEAGSAFVLDPSISGVTRDRVLNEIDAKFKRDNGFCDPFDDGTVTTGTGAGGANPGTVPSIAAIKTEDGLLFRTEDGRVFLSQDPAPNVGVVFKGA